jgi:hypothetical protein
MMYSHRGVHDLRFPDLRPIGTPIPDSWPNRESPGDSLFRNPIPGQIGNRGIDGVTGIPPPDSRPNRRESIGGTGIGDFRVYAARRGPPPM